MSLYITQIKKKIKNKIQLEEIEIIDNSDADRSHKYFQKVKQHLKGKQIINVSRRAKYIIITLSEKFVL